MASVSSVDDLDVSFPWTLAVATIVGIGIIFLPTLFGTSIDTTAADIAHLGGALIVTVSQIEFGVPAGAVERETELRTTDAGM